MAADTCAQPGVHHRDCRCTVTGVPTIGVDRLPGEQPEPVVVCASCGRSVDMPPRLEGQGRHVCETPDWHQPQPEVPDVDVSAEDGDDLVPMDDDDLQAAVGPRPGQTWADLYGRTHVALSYKGAQLEGVTRELVRVRNQLAQQQLAYDALVRDTMRHLAAIVRTSGKPRQLGQTDDVLELRVPLAELEATAGEVAWWDDRASNQRVWQVKR